MNIENETPPSTPTSLTPTPVDPQTESLPPSQPVTPTLAPLPVRPIPEPPPDNPGLLEVAQRRYANVVAMLQGKNVEADLDVDFVHDLRVASRRLSEVVGVIEQAGSRLMEKPASKALADTLKKLRQSAGDLRDQDVLEEHLRKGHFGRDLGKMRKALLETMAEKRKDLMEKLREELMALSLHEAIMLLTRWLEKARTEGHLDATRGQTATPVKNDMEETMEEALWRRIKKRRKQLKQAFGKAAHKQTPESFHQARIAVKKLRYALELADEGHMLKAVKDLKKLKKMQEHLGQMHDVEVIIETLADHVAEYAPQLPHLRPQWNQWKRKTHSQQAQRAAKFFGMSYAWINAAK